MMDIFAEKSLDWGSVSVAIQGNDVEWTQMNSQGLWFGKKTSVNFMLPPRLAGKLDEENSWFQLIIMVNTGRAGNLYIDNLRAE